MQIHVCFWRGRPASGAQHMLWWENRNSLLHLAVVWHQFAVGHIEQSIVLWELKQTKVNIIVQALFHGDVRGRCHLLHTGTCAANPLLLAAPHNRQLSGACRSHPQLTIKLGAV